MFRKYSVEFDDGTIPATNACELFYLAAGVKGLALLGITLGQKIITSIEGRGVLVRHLAATVTASSGGVGAKTPQPLNPNDTAAVFTARVLDTSVATTSGASTIKHSDTWMFLNGYFFDWSDKPIICGPSEAIVVRLPTGPSAAMTSGASGTAYVAELF